MTECTEISQTEMCVPALLYEMHTGTLNHWDRPENPVCAGQRSHINVAGVVCSCSDTLC